LPRLRLAMTSEAKFLDPGAGAGMTIHELL
jgi:hypothetical protein